MRKISRVEKILEGDYSLDTEDRERQISQIIKKLPTLEDEHILDIADNIWWGAKKFYDPTKEVVLPADKVKKIMETHPELLVWM